MKSNELMIGDFFLYKGNVVEIVTIDCGTETVWIDGKKVSALRKVSDLQSIPLTPEILEKNGFHINGIPNSITSVKAIDDWSDDTYVWSRQETPDERMFVSVYMDDPANFFVEVYCQYCHVDGIHVKYLHQLQNALKLCGIDKEIVL